jgi:hypothetical protein
MHIEVVKAAAEITREAVAHTTTNAMGIGPLNRVDEVVEFLEKITNKLDKLYNKG